MTRNSENVSPRNDDTIDSVKKNKEEVTCVLITFTTISIILYAWDVIMDIKLAVSHFTDGNVWFFGQTVCSLIIPAIILTGFNIWWYKLDAQLEDYKVSNKLWLIRIVFIILLMAPLVRNFEALCYAIKSYQSKDERKKKKYYERMVVFSTDAAILNVLEAFMESGPQVVLQTCIFAKLQMSNVIMTATEYWQIVMILMSVISMAAANGAYQRTLRIALNDRGRLNIPTTVYVIVWRFFEIMSRIIALGLFASVFPYYLLAFCSIHFFVMFCWIRSMKTDFFQFDPSEAEKIKMNQQKIGNTEWERNYVQSKDKDPNEEVPFCIKEFVYNLVLGEVFIFMFFNPKMEPTRTRYRAFYALIFMENTGLILAWFFYSSQDIHFRWPALTVQILSFVIAIIMMVIYYYYLHPTIGKIALKSKNKKKSDIRKKKIVKNVGKGKQLEIEMNNFESSDTDENENVMLNTEEQS